MITRSSFSEPLIRKRQRTAAVQDAAARFMAGEQVRMEQGALNEPAKWDRHPACLLSDRLEACPTLQQEHLFMDPMQLFLRGIAASDSV
jgi:hypothetical protein